MKTLDQLVRHPLLAGATHLGDDLPAGGVAEGFVVASEHSIGTPQLGDDCEVAGLDLGLCRERYDARSLIVDVSRVRRWLHGPGAGAVAFEDGELMLLPADVFVAFVVASEGKDGADIIVGVEAGRVRAWRVPVASSSDGASAPQGVAPPPITWWSVALSAPGWLAEEASLMAEGAALERVAAAGLFARGCISEDDDAVYDKVSAWMGELGDALAAVEAAACERAAQVGVAAEALPDAFGGGPEAAAAVAARLTYDRDHLQSVWVALRLAGAGRRLGEVLKGVDAAAADVSFALQDALGDHRWSDAEQERWYALGWQEPLSWWIPELVD